MLALVDPIVFGTIIDKFALGWTCAWPAPALVTRMPDDAQHDVSFAAKLGETIVFVGPSGCAKSTLVKLLVGLYSPAGGDVLYNDISTRAPRFNLARRRSE